MKVGDRVAWLGGFNFGAEVRGVAGTVVKVGLGIPVHRHEGIAGTPSYRCVVDHYEDAVEVVADGHVPQVHEVPNIVAVKDLRRPCGICGNLHVPGEPIRGCILR